MTRTRYFVLLVAGLLLLAGCSGLSSEPDIVAEIPLPTPAPELAPPAAPPDLAAGAAFYAEHCAMCHGDTGRGDGSMVLDGRLQNAPPDLSDPATVYAQSPMDYMRAITDGNVVSGMPPFSRYTPEERWNVAAYVYTGSVTADDLTLGAAVYEIHCAACHGPEGRGDGPDAPEIMPDLTALDAWADATNEALAQTISQGVMPGMPGFGEELSAGELQAVVGYVRALSVTGEPGFVAPAGGEAESVAAPAATEEVIEQASAESAPPATPAADNAAAEVDAPEAITVTGTVTNGTAGADVPADVPITLHMFDPPDFAETTLDGVIESDGSYRFEDVPYLPERVYLVSLQYNDVFFSSTVYQLDDPANPLLETSLQVFEITNDPAVLRFTAGVMRITFTHFGMDVAEVLSVENNSDRLYLSDEVLSENQRVALRIPLPPGAGGVGFEPGMQGTRFLTDENESVIIDTQPVRPGRDDLFFSYFIPYEDGAIIEQELPIRFEGPFHILIEADQVDLTGGQFTVAGERVDMGGAAFDAYIAQLALEPGDALSFELSGTPDAVNAFRDAGQEASGGLNPLLIAIIVIGVVLIGVGGFLFLLRQGDVAEESSSRIDELLEEIADLDNRHDRGEINHDLYHRTRAALKAELAELMREQSDES
ncbi:MAG: hypothetical protein Kow0077_00550 [Anaerolineae bacterium]